MGGDADIGVDAEAGNRRTARAGRDSEIFPFDGVADFRDPPAGTRSCGYPPRDGSAVEFGEQRLIALQGVGLLRIGLGPQAAAFEQPGDAAVNAIGHAGHFGIAGRSHMPENDFALLIDDVDAVQRQGMEVGIETEGVTEALHEADGAAAGLPVRGGNAGPAADRGKHRAHKDLQNVADQRRVISEAIAKGKGKRQHPLPHRHFGEDTIHEMGGSVGHPPAAA